MQSFKDFLKETVIDAVHRFGNSRQRATAQHRRDAEHEQAFDDVNLLAQWAADTHKDAMRDPANRKEHMAKVDKYHKKIGHTMAWLERNAAERVHKRMGLFLGRGNPPAYQHYLSAIDQRDDTKHLNTKWEQG